jgi:hypothetical protein
MESPDFRQLRRYMDDLDAPGLLIDAHSVLLVRRGEDSPYAEVVRSEATWDDVVTICNLLGDGFDARRNRALPMQTAPLVEGRVSHTEEGEQPQVFVAYAPAWHFGERQTKSIPVVALLATSAEAPAVEALPIIDSPAFHAMAQHFLQGNSCASVAEEYLNGFLQEEHALLTLVGLHLYKGGRLPQGSPALAILKRLGIEEEPNVSQGRTARRG